MSNPCVAVGHDLNPNDWGYDGGTHVDVWCRRCKGKVRVPADEWPEAKAMWAEAKADEGLR